MNAAIDELRAVVKKYAELDMFFGYEIISPESKGPDGDSPFHMAAYDGDLEAVRIMLPYITDVNFGGDIGNTPLHYSVLNNKPEMARFLLSHGADSLRGNDYGDTPVDFMEGKEYFKNFSI